MIHEKWDRKADPWAEWSQSHKGLPEYMPRVKDAMVRRLTVVNLMTSIRDAALILSQSELQVLLVFEQTTDIGIVSTRNIVFGALVVSKRHGVGTVGDVI